MKKKRFKITHVKSGDSVKTTDTKLKDFFDGEDWVTESVSDYYERKIRTALGNLLGFRGGFTEAPVGRDLCELEKGEILIIYGKGVHSTGKNTWSESTYFQKFTVELVGRK